MKQLKWTVPAVASACVLALSACGGDDESSTTGASGASDGGGSAQTQGIDPASIASAKGNVTFCAPALTVEAAKAAVKQAQAETKGLKVQVITLPDAADEQNAQFVRRQRAKSGECDVFESDVVWTAQFAAQKWLMDVTDYVNGRKGEFIPSTLQTATYDGRYYGVPEKTDAGLLYYRKDRTSTPPDTWQALYSAAKDEGGFVFQGKAYEGLTVHFLEVAYGAGGKVLSDDGKKSEINSPQNLAALKLMADGVKSGAVPKAVLTYQEAESQQAFDSGKPGFMRNWPYAYSIEKESKTAAVRKNFEVAPLPKFEGGQAAGVLGGSNLVISKFSKNPEGALKFVDVMTKPDAMRLRATKYSLAPVLSESYDDADVKKALPFSDALRTAVEQAKARPVSPSYTQISTAISTNVAKALSGRMTPEAALEAADKSISSALSTF
ncbi:ABC transporter substrate-binding protein [Patulibacter sp. SYSU D01012]|uniref:ABC transporter substrate-binding protein n=1 Tax=Patulibacter sp. SYSU D01012 TaxID=2817381 RepID=UPI001B31594B